MEGSEVNILIDASQSLSLRGGGCVSLVSANEVEGYNIGGGICGEANRHKVFFVARFSRPAVASGLWIGDRLVEQREVSAQDTSLGCWFRFRMQRNSSVVVAVGISYVSVENARRNLEVELPGWDFDSAREEARTAWQRELSIIRVEGGSGYDLTRFYTALYHALIHPSILSDANGDYPLMGRAGTGHAEDADRYSVFSLWDTYRTVHPLLTLVYPERQAAIVRSMIAMYRESGWLPKWELAGNEVYLMVGDPAVIVVADSYINGITDIDIQTALEAMKKPAALTTSETSPPIRAGYHEYLSLGYIPVDQDTTKEWWVWGPASTTLEYCLADWALAQVARKLGKMEDADEFERRSSFYRNLFDTTSLFIRPRLRNGAWLPAFDPNRTEGSGSWSGSGGPGYVEGDAWHYTWFVPHDMQGLIRLFGGKERFVAKLQQCFDTQEFTITNEPDIAYPYLFTYIPGEEQRTTSLVQKIRSECFGTDPGGLPGNDDAGTISAWFVFSALGFYPACPGSGTYQIGIPLFEKATITLSEKYWPGIRLSITVQGSPAPPGEVRAVSFRGSRLPSFQITHKALVSGGDLVFVLSR